MKWKFGIVNLASVKYNIINHVGVVEVYYSMSGLQSDLNMCWLIHAHLHVWHQC